MVNWDTDHFTMRADKEARELIRRNKDYLDENYGSTTELFKEGLRYVDEQNGTLQDKITRLKKEERELQQEATEKRQRRKELQEKLEEMERRQKVNELKSEIDSLSKWEGKTREEIEEEIVSKIMERRGFDSRSEVMDSKYSSQIPRKVDKKMQKVEELNQKKKRLQEVKSE